MLCEEIEGKITDSSSPRSYITTTNWQRKELKGDLLTTIG